MPSVRRGDLLQRAPPRHGVDGRIHYGSYGGARPHQRRGLLEPPADVLGELRAQRLELRRVVVGDVAQVDAVGAARALGDARGRGGAQALPDARVPEWSKAVEWAALEAASSNT